MTRKQIEAARKTLYGIYPKDYTPEQKKLDDELWCREMINSCIIYAPSVEEGIREFYEECGWRIGDKSYAARYIRVLGADRVAEIVNEQVEDFKKAMVIDNVYTDSDGVTYNSIVWADD